MFWRENSRKGTVMRSEAPPSPHPPAAQLTVATCTLHNKRNVKWISPFFRGCHVSNLLILLDNDWKVIINSLMFSFVANLNWSIQFLVLWKACVVCKSRFVANYVLFYCKTFCICGGVEKIWEQKWRWVLKMPTQLKKMVLNFIRKCTGAPFKWHGAMQGPRCWYVHDNKYISTSRCGAEGAPTKITWAQKISWGDINYLGRKELRVALPELRDLFMRQADFSGGAAQLVHWATS